MAQHFLLSAAARALDLDEIHQMSEDDARLQFRALCWPDTGGDPVCPECGGLDHWTLGKGNKWRCKACRISFSPTSHTAFKSHKLSYRKLLIVAANFCNGVNGVAACQMQRILKIGYKSAFVLLHKIREVMGNDGDAEQLGGVVEIDGPGKVRTFLLNKEGDAIEIARRMVMPDAVLHADFGTQWEPLHLYFETKRINHSEAYSKDGACTNMAESFFSRMRTAERGVHKILSGAHLVRHAKEMGWREQYRRRSNLAQFERIIGQVGSSRPSTTFQGYSRKRPINDDHPFATAA